MFDTQIISMPIIYFDYPLRQIVCENIESDINYADVFLVAGGATLEHEYVVRNNRMGLANFTSGFSNVDYQLIEVDNDLSNFWNVNDIFDPTVLNKVEKGEFKQLKEIFYEGKTETQEYLERLNTRRLHAMEIIELLNKIGIQEHGAGSIKYGLKKYLESLEQQ